jgi:hypothetical protein
MKNASYIHGTEPSELANDDASCQFVWNRAVGVKP